MADTNTNTSLLSTWSTMQLKQKVPTKPLIEYIDVYINNFVGLAQGFLCRRIRIRSLLLHAAEKKFQPPDTLDPENRRDPISTRKLLKGNGAWETNKLIIVWLVDAITGIIQLPAHRADRICAILRVFAPDCKRASIKIFHILLREICSMVLDIPGGLNLLSALQYALSKVTSEGSIRLTRPMHYFLAYFRLLASRIAEIIPGDPNYLGTVDSAVVGMGGVWLPNTSQSPEVLQPHYYGAKYFCSTSWITCAPSSTRWIHH